MATRDATVNLIANPSGFKAGMDAASAEADLAGKKFGDSMDSASSRVGRIFNHLGQTMSNWGIPFGESVSKVADKFDEASSVGHVIWLHLYTHSGFTAMVGPRH